MDICWSCLTLCDPIDGSPPGSPIPGILQARTLEWVAISSSNAWKWKVKVKSLSCVWLLATPWTAASFPVHHKLPELAQTHFHQVGDATQPSHPLSSPSPPAFNLSQNQSFPMSQFFASGGQIIGASASASVLPMNIQDWFPLGWAGWISLQSKELSRVFSNTTVPKY